MGWDTKIKWLATEYSLSQGDLLVGFGTSPQELDVTDPAAVADAVHEFLPEAEVVATDAHDWNTDELSQGTWMAYRPGQVMRYASSLQRPDGRLAFAGSDLASGWAGWIEGAVESGQRAGRAANESPATRGTGVNLDKSVQRRRCGLSFRDDRHAVGWTPQRVQITRRGDR